MALIEDIMAQSLWLKAWVGWMALVNLAALIFLRRIEARWIAAAMLVAFALMNVLHAQFGYQRILGLAHVAAWTPLLIYLWRRRAEWNLSSLSGKWLVAVFTTDLTSLVIDYADVARYLMGERI